jgi:predicted MFS family arabinose efflux permease
VVLVGNLSSAAAGGPFAWLLQAFGWREAILALAVLSAAVGIASWRFVDELPRPRSVHLEAGWGQGLRGVFRNPATWPILLANFGMGASFMSFATLWAVPYLVDVHGMSRVDAANHVTVLLGVFAFGGLAFGTVSDKIGRRKPLFVGGAAVLAAAWVPLLAGWPVSGVGGYTLVAAMGFAAAGMTVSWACSKEVNAPQYAGIATGVVNMGIFLGPAMMQPAVGWVLDLGRGADAVAAAHSPEEWRRGLLVLAGLAAFGLASALFVRETRARNSYREAGER